MLSQILACRPIRCRLVAFVPALQFIARIASLAACHLTYSIEPTAGREKTIKQSWGGTCSYGLAIFEGWRGTCLGALVGENRQQRYGSRGELCFGNIGGLKVWGVHLSGVGRQIRLGLAAVCFAVASRHAVSSSPRGLLRI